MRGDNEIGLVLAGGGAKGAFQVGVLQAMEEEGLLPYVTAVSGTSAGALNAVLGLNVDIETMAKIWLNLNIANFLGIPTKNKKYTLSINWHNRYHIIDISSLFGNQEQIKPTKMLYYDNSDAGTEEKSGASILRNSVLSAVNSSVCGLASQREISKLIYQYIDIHKTFTSSIDCYITCYHNYKKIQSDSENATEVFLINGKDGDIFHEHKIWTPCHIHNILLASSALPFIYTPVNINGKMYSDGGIESKSSEQLKKSGEGNVPYNVLLENDTYKNLIIVDFEDTSIPPQPGKNIIEIKLHQSNLLEDKLLGLVDFTTQNICQLIESGKKEAKKTFTQFRDAIDKIKSNPPPFQKPKYLEWDKSTIYKDLYEVANAIKLGQIEIIFKSDSKTTMKALSQIFSYHNSEIPSFAEIPVPSFTLPVLRFFNNIFGKQLADEIRKYTCYPIPNSDCIRLYLNKI